MMVRSLYSQLSLVLFLLLCMVGLLLALLIKQSSVMYQQEVAQKLNRELAANIIAEYPLFDDDQSNRQMLDKLFHQLMVTNPSIELYLLDPQGKIIEHAAEEGKVKRQSVGLEAIRNYLQADAEFPLMGDDPRDPQGQKVFSAARIGNEEGLHGYLYIILGGEQYDNTAHMISDSYVLHSTLVVLLAALAAALIAGLIIFALLTRRLRWLGKIMQGYSQQGDIQPAFTAYTASQRQDEIDQLGLQFNAMARQIGSQVGQLKKMDSLRREMIANVSHDLRTPLTTIKGYLETLLLKQGELSADEQQHYLLTALHNSQHLHKLVEELFELARLDSCESVVYSEPFSMCELVQDVVQSFQLRAQEKNIRLETHLHTSAPPVYADIAMMQRVMENLLANGLRHTPEGGLMSVSVELASASVLVKVRDTGQGIAEKDLPRIFERFYQRDANRTESRHAGLGLAIVKRILELHNCVIQVSSELGYGTTFSFQIPAQPVSL